MTRQSKQQPIILIRQEEKKQQNRIQNTLISIACLGCFPLIFLIGKTVMSLMG